LTRDGVLVARSKEGNEEMLAKLSRLGIRCAAVETIAMEEEGSAVVERAVAGIGGYDWVAFTSPRAVAVFRKAIEALSLDPTGLKPKFAAVGASTAAALKSAGVAVSFVPEEYLTSALGRGLPLQGGRRVLLLRADIGDRELVSTLEARGFEVNDVTVYRTKYVGGPLDIGMFSKASVVVFASPSEVEGLRRRAGGGFSEFAARARAICIGPVTAKAARAAGFSKVDFAGEHTADALASKVEEALVHA
jgi:uroporphyrinogen-III synthase